MNTLLITGGRIIDPATGMDATADVLIQDGRVAAMEQRPGTLSKHDAEQHIDAEGCLVTPGLIDIHVHLRDPDETAAHEETISTGAAAAVNGGFTTICCMPNTRPALDTPEQVEYVHRQAVNANQCRVFVVACATEARRGIKLAPLRELAEAGAVGFTDDGDVIASEAIMRDVLREAKNLDRIVMQHCQELSLTKGASMNAGPVAERLGEIGWPAIAEESIIERDIALNRDIGARYHAQHLSSTGSVEIIRAAQDEGIPITSEVSPHHLLLTDDDVERLGPIAKMNPPLRAKTDIAGLKHGVASGVITVLATDHAPHPMDTKQRPLAEASFGVVGVDCALALYAQALIAGSVIDWTRMIAMMTVNPARLVGLDQYGFGRLTIGGPADVTVIDPDLAWTIHAEQFASAGRNCPFEGWDVAGRAVATIVNGEVRLLRERARGRSTLRSRS